MTFPTPTGYPDWGRFASRNTKIYFDNSILATPVFADEGPFFVGDVPYLLFDALNTAGDRARFQFRFFGDPTPADFIRAYAFTLNPSGTINTNIPVSGPWVVLRHVSDTVNTTITSVTVSGSWTPSHATGFGVDDTILFSGSDSISAGANLVDELQRTIPAEATVSLQASSGPARMNLQSRALSGVLTVFLYMSVPGNNETQVAQVFLPPTPIRVVRFNDHTASSFVRGAIIARPLGPGV